MDDEMRAVGSYIRRELSNVDPRLLVLNFDTEYDTPLDHAFPVGLLQMLGAFDPPAAAGMAQTAIRVGAYWCRIVQADVEYDLLLGRRLITESAASAAQLTESCGKSPNGGDTFASYAAARWHDGAGRIHYRLGAHGLAAQSFKTAKELAQAANLWWCLPDLSSNFARAQFELETQTANKVIGFDDRGKLLDALTKLHKDFRLVANEHGIDPARPGSATDVRGREFLRGYSNVLHNLATVLREVGKPSESLERTAESIAISEALGDQYRIAQSTLNRAFIQRDIAPQHFAWVHELPWKRGKLIAEQNLAAARLDRDGLRMLDRILENIRGDGLGEALISGVDVDYYAYTVRAYSRTIEALLPDASDEFSERLEHDLRERSLEMASSVRRVVTLPAYKRIYAKTVRPVYLKRIQYELDREPPRYEQAFGLVEEASARELLDLMANTELPLLPPPEGRHEIVSSQVEEPDPLPAPTTGTRTGLVRASEAGSFRRAVNDSSTEFEELFARHPLQLAPHDPDIAHRLTSFAVNHPDTCLVRYFVQGWDEDDGVPTGLGAFVSRGTALTSRRGLSYLEVRELARTIASNDDLVPTEADAKDIWRLLIAPIWDLITADGPPAHLVFVPTDEIFAIPLQVALSDEPGAVPLGALLPMSLSASATTFVGRGRHLLKRQAVAADDDLAVLMGIDPSATGGELVGLRWPKEHFVVAGEPPDAIVDAVTRHPGDWLGVRALVDCKPEFFLFVGHGVYDPKARDLGPGLMFGDHFLTQFDVALRLRLPRNKLTALAACVAGRGMQSPGGDVLGFVRSFIASGAGAVAVPLWNVQDSAMVATVGRLLRASREAVETGGGVFDVVDTLHSHYREVMNRPYESFAERVGNLPLALYL
ncbi:CHAT domain-containing protein [Embleya scabrispora]|uniref:CHAT domain-containing protein n=1 Tax=Embleya scabrispora TaxID=159449 RepID=UPI00039AD830|nr:CHAT domain-containing protein [Embleya scabrispora]MYS86268.1 CHAT domain-containing protein [Streptomyces sp. SID5474]